MPRIVVNGNEYTAPVGSCLYSWTQLAGLTFPCGGHGICGKCRVVVDGAVSPVTDAERRFLTSEDICNGVRLACLTYVAGDCSVQSDKRETPCVCAEGNIVIEMAQPRFSHYGVAIDIGTTTLAGRLYDRQGVSLAQSGILNPQMRFGADVLSRGKVALTDGVSLADAVRGGIRELLGILAADAGIRTAEIDGLVITGNTIMLCLLTNTSVEDCIRAPFRSERLFGESVSASCCGLDGFVGTEQIYIPYCADVFLGADLTCAIQAVGLCDIPRTALLVDVGTNGEMALWHHGRLYLCSTAAGPAFEGVGISCGMVASDGAIDNVQIVNGSVFSHIIGNVQARGICGTGLIDATACLLNLGEMEDNGNIEEDYPLADTVVLTQEDVRALQVSKSAVCSAIETLLHTANISPKEVEVFYVAGGFGAALNAINAERIGLYPPRLSGRMISMGNAALDGASRYLLDGNAGVAIQSMLRDARKVDLATDVFFAAAFLRNMNFE